MAWKESHKQETRLRILKAGADLFTQKGFNQVGIDDVMQAAGLTRGAFYAHFNSKFELYEESTLFAGKQAIEQFNTSHVVGDIINNYLSHEHLLAERIRCPLACLVSDVSHDDVRIKKSYTKLFKGFLRHLANINSQQDKNTILLQAITMIGGMAIARSITDKELTDNILSVSNEAVIKLTE